MSKVLMSDAEGNPAYPLITKDCIVTNANATYNGQEISLSQTHICNISEVGTLTASSSGLSVQGILYTDGELYQFYDGGTVDVYDVSSVELGGAVAPKRTFTIPGVSVHFGGVDWLDESSKVLITHGNSTNSLYKIDISDEANISVQTIATPGIPASVIAHGGIVCCDKVNNIVYLTGYLHADESNTNSERTGVTIYSIDPATGDSAHIIDMPPFHLQDSKFHNGLIFYANDSTVGTASGYNTQRIVVANIVTGIVSIIRIPNISGIEAEGICVVNDDFLYETMTSNHRNIRVNKVSFE